MLRMIMIIEQYRGIFVPIPTPFSESHLAINYEFLLKHLETLSSKGIDGIIVAGFEGEFPSLSLDERKSLIKWVMKYRQRLKVIVHVGSSSLVETITLANFTCDQGADALLLSVPDFYGMNTEQGVIEFYQRIMDQLDCPAFLYNSPYMQVTDNLIEELLNYNYFCGIVNWVHDVTMHEISAGKLSRIHLLDTREHQMGQIFNSGAGGVVSVVSNLIPEIAVGIYHAHKQHSDATYLQQRLNDCIRLLAQFPLHAALKYMMYLLDYENTSVRPPLVNLTIAQKKRIENEFARLQFIE